MNVPAWLLITFNFVRLIPSGQGMLFTLRQLFYYWLIFFTAPCYNFWVGDWPGQQRGESSIHCIMYGTQGYLCPVLNPPRHSFILKRDSLRYWYSLTPILNLPSHGTGNDDEHGEHKTGQIFPCIQWLSSENDFNETSWLRVPKMCNFPSKWSPGFFFVRPPCCLWSYSTRWLQRKPRG